MEEAEALAVAEGLPSTSADSGGSESAGARVLVRERDAVVHESSEMSPDGLGKVFDASRRCNSCV